MSNITSEVVRITPAVAMKWLGEHNASNRSLRQAWVNRYAKAITEGKWQVAQPITFDRNGTLLDGQHRLAAIIQAGVSVEVLVIRGVEPEAFDTIDIGGARTVRDLARHAGLPTAVGVLGGTRWWMLLEAGFSPSNNHAAALISNYDIVDYLAQADGDFLAWLTLMENQARTFSSSTAWVAAAWAITNAGVPQAEFATFLDVVRYGDNLDRDDPRLGLRNLILGRIRNSHFGYTLFATIIDVWNMNVRGRRARIVRATPAPPDYELPRILIPERVEV